MAGYETHREKSVYNWTLAKKIYDRGEYPFLCLNQAMYAVGHAIEAALALEHKHPSASARGVPHADRERLLRSFLLKKGIVDEKFADAYTELSNTRHTFGDDDVPEKEFLTNFLAQSEYIIKALDQYFNTINTRQVIGGIK